MPGISAAHFLMYEPGPTSDTGDDWSVLPKDAWTQVRFENVEFLFVSPFCVQPDGAFGLDDPKTRDHTQKGTMDNRLRRVLELARAANPKIKILAQQWWDRLDYQTLSEMKASDPAVYDIYAASVKAVVKQWNLDGYDVDYEWRSNQQRGNLDPDAPVIISKVRAQLNDLEKELNRKIYVTCSPASSQELVNTDQSKEHPLKDIVDYVNLQTYDGGININKDDFIEAGLQPSQLLYGVWPEDTTESRSPTIDKVLQEYNDGKLGGVHLWRVNSDNTVFENQVQALIYDALHGTSVGGYTASDVKTEWASKRWDRPR